MSLSNSFNALFDNFNGYSWVEGNSPNLNDPSGMIFWSFPTGGNKDRILEATSYRNTLTGQCSTANAHAWIERWLEVNNGTLETQLEFPGGGQRSRIDAIVFEDLDLQLAPAIHRGGSRGLVFEIAPVDPLAKIADEFGEVLSKWLRLTFSISPFSRVGNYPTVDFWIDPNQTVLDSFIGSSGAKYDWSDVPFYLGDRLAPGISAGPVKVDQNKLGGVNDIQADAAIWIILGFPGLILYATECQIRKRAKTAGAVTALLAAKHFRDRLAEREKRGKGYGRPIPQPTFAIPPIEWQNDSDVDRLNLECICPGLGPLLLTPEDSIRPILPIFDLPLPIIEIP